MAAGCYHIHPQTDSQPVPGYLLILTVWTANVMLTMAVQVHVYMSPLATLQANATLNY